MFDKSMVEETAVTLLLVAVGLLLVAVAAVAAVVGMRSFPWSRGVECKSGLKQIGYTVSEYTQKELGATGSDAPQVDEAEEEPGLDAHKGEGEAPVGSNTSPGEPSNQSSSTMPREGQEPTIQAAPSRPSTSTATTIRVMSCPF